jgi:hypothetical protein
MFLVLRVFASTFSAIALLSLLSACASTPSNTETHAQVAARLTDKVAVLVQRYPAGKTTEQEVADLAANEADEVKGEIDRWYSAAQDACYDRFFVNACLYSLKKKQRELTTAVLPISVEAKTLQRKLRVDEMDKNLEQKRLESEQKKASKEGEEKKS